MKTEPIEVGKTYAVRYPFVMEEVSLPPDDPEGMRPVVVSNWRPGCLKDTYDHDCSTVYVAESHGEMLLTVVDVHRPGKFPTRVFFTRKWKDPSGKVFGKGGLHIMTAQAFRRRLRGYLHHYEMT